jgi:DNA invertase Pin-like site-specific DNA recombinase
MIYRYARVSTDAQSVDARGREGRTRAAGRGVTVRRKPKLTPHQQAEAIKRRDKGETLTEIARSYNLSHTTISRLAPVEVLRG